MRQTQGTQASGHCQKLVSVARAGPFVGLLTDSTRLAEVRGRLGTVCAGAVVLLLEPAGKLFWRLKWKALPVILPFGL
jgi:hypothetical protein